MLRSIETRGGIEMTALLVIKEGPFFSDLQFRQFMDSLEQFYVDIVNDPFTNDYDSCIMGFIRGYVEQSGKEFTEEQLTKVEDYVLELEKE